jgi:transcriptional antiterminator NusG
MTGPESDNTVHTTAGGGQEAAPPAPAPAPAATAKPEPKGVEPTRSGMKWYVLRVASNKEDQVCEALERKVKVETLQQRVGRILVPTAKEKRMKAGQVKVYERKLYPGYVFVEMSTELDGSIPEAVWFMVKETMGVGDFIGSDNKPTSMRDHDVEMMLLAAAKKEDEEAALQGLEFAKGDRVKIKEGSFQNFEGQVDSIDETKGIVTVLLTIFGRATPVDVEYWQLEKM